MFEDVDPANFGEHIVFVEQIINAPSIYRNPKENIFQIEVSDIHFIF